MSIHEIKKHFTYDPSTGDLRRVTRKNSNGSVDAYGYLIIKFRGEQYKAHRICWLMHYGMWPVGVIDHINGCKTDNRIINLRDVNQAENVRNRADEGIYIDTATNGLRAKYTIKDGSKTYRFRDLSMAQQARRQIDNKIGITRRAQI